MSDLAYETFTETVAEWAAIRTAARWEKMTAQKLQELGVSCYLPIIKKIVKYKTRTNTSRIPIFAGYVFFDHDQLPVIHNLSSDSNYLIAQILRAPNPHVLRKELSEIAEVLQNNSLLQSVVYGNVGDVVRIKRGSFKDFEGKVVRCLPNAQRLTLTIAYLGLTMEVEVNDDVVERVHIA